MTGTLLHELVDCTATPSRSRSSAGAERVPDVHGSSRRVSPPTRRSTAVSSAKPSQSFAARVGGRRGPVSTIPSTIHDVVRPASESVTALPETTPGSSWSRRRFTTNALPLPGAASGPLRSFGTNIRVPDGRGALKGNGLLHRPPGPASAARGRPRLRHPPRRGRFGPRPRAARPAMRVPSAPRCRSVANRRGVPRTRSRQQVERTDVHTRRQQRASRASGPWLAAAESIAEREQERSRQFASTAQQAITVPPPALPIPNSLNPPHRNATSVRDPGWRPPKRSRVPARARAARSRRISKPAMSLSRSAVDCAYMRPRGRGGSAIAHARDRGRSRAEVHGRELRGARLRLPSSRRSRAPAPTASRDQVDDEDGRSPQHQDAEGALCETGASRSDRRWMWRPGIGTSSAPHWARVFDDAAHVGGDAADGVAIEPPVGDDDLQFVERGWRSELRQGRAAGEST